MTAYLTQKHCYDAKRHNNAFEYLNDPLLCMKTTMALMALSVESLWQLDYDERGHVLYASLTDPQAAHRSRAKQILC